MKKSLFCLLLCLLVALPLSACAAPQNTPDEPNADHYYTVTYTNITFPSADTQAPDWQERVLRGSLAPAMSLAGDEQYVLEGWYCDGVKWDFNRHAVTSDICLVANWVKREYTVGYRILEEIRLEGIVYYGETAGDPYVDMYDRFISTIEYQDMIEQGYVFVGWMLEDKRWDFENDVVTEDIVLDALFLPADEVDK